MYKYEKELIKFLEDLKFVRTDDYFLRFELKENNIKYNISAHRTDAVQANIILEKYENNERKELLPCSFMMLKNYFKYKLRLERIEKLLKDGSLDSKR